MTTILVGLFLSCTTQRTVAPELLLTETTGNVTWTESICNVTPLSGSDVKGNVTIDFTAPNMDTAWAMCWRGEGKRKSDVLVGTVRLDASHHGRISFSANKFPHGPMTVRLFAQNSRGEKDLYELQLYNTAGTRNSGGIPDTIPAAARGLELLFSDDFDSPELSIANDGRGARYNAHKPRFGDFSGWPFTDVTSELNPFSQRDTYLKIAARKPSGTKGSTGLLASVDMDGKGFWVNAPCYLECRFIAQSAPGTWPAFWTLNQMDNKPGDELDVIEAYGGWGEGNPSNSGYICTTHYWLQQDENGRNKPGVEKQIEMEKLGNGTSWSAAFHTYAVLIGLDYTVYYLDDIEVFRHPTGEMSRTLPHFFLINYAIGGASGWKINLDRYNNSSDMYVDFVRVFGTSNR